MYIKKRKNVIIYKQGVCILLKMQIEFWDEEGIIEVQVNM